MSRPPPGARLACCAHWSCAWEGAVGLELCRIAGVLAGIPFRTARRRLPVRWQTCFQLPCGSLHAALPPLYPAMHRSDRRPAPPAPCLQVRLPTPRQQHARPAAELAVGPA